jgi:hypothetical protein
MVDLSSLAALGKVAGLGGIALGVVALLVRPAIDRTSGVPAPQRASLLRFITMGAFGIGALGIVAWLVSGLWGGTVAVTAGQGGMAAGRDVSGNTVTIGQPPQGGGAASPPAAGPGVSAAPGGMAAGRDVSGNSVTIGQPSQADTSAPGAKPP